MSVQLIVYPQTYDGTYNSIATTSNTEFFSDGIYFNTVMAATPLVVTSSNAPQEAIDYFNTTLPVNSWGRYYEPSDGVTVSTFLNLVTGASTRQVGVLQKLSNLTIGATYELKIDINLIVNTVNTFGVQIYTGTNLQSLHPLPTVQGMATIQFTANSTEDTIVILGTSTIAQLLFISSISVMEAGGTPTGAIQLLGDGQVICDLYEDEDLPLTLSVDDFKNVAEKVQSYSKSFNLPATKRNNKIFNHLFEITRSDDGLIFNAYKKTQCILKQDGFILFNGYLRLLDVVDKNGEISYNVNLYSEVIALADTLKDRAFRDLNFTELEHDYNKTEIKASWNPTGTGIAYTNPSTSGFRDANSTVKYPFVDWNHQIFVGGVNSNAATVGNPELTSLETAFRPFINIKYLVDRIFAATPFTYSSDFLNSSDFKKLYMDFNWGGEIIPSTPVTTIESGWAWSLVLYGNVSNYANTTYSVLDLREWGFWGVVFSEMPDNYDIPTNIITSTAVNEFYTVDYSYTIENVDTVDRTVECRWLYNSTPINYSGIITIAAGSTYTYAGNFSQSMTTIGDTLQAQFKSDDASGTKIRQEQIGSFCTDQCNTATVIWGVSIAALTDNILLQTLRGELGQWDFLKGLITMFNLVTLPDEDNPNNIKIEPYSDVFINSTDSVQLDWTEKIDVSEMKLTPLADLNRKTIFKFVEDEDDYSFNQYKNLVGGHLYGSKKFNATDEFNILDGEEEIVAEPFAATIIKPLMDIFTDFITPAIYSYGGDGVWEGFDNSPRIMCDNGIKDTGASYYIPEQNGLFSENQTNFLQFSHLSTVPTNPNSLDFHFGECQLMPGVGSPTVNNLFGLYWSAYFNELYNPNTRTMTIKVNLTPADINTFKFNDTVYIKNRVFRVNKIDYKPNDLATVEFILIT